MNILGIDHGTKRIGLAIARQGLKIAYPLTTLDNSNTTLTELESIIQTENIGLIVLGLPRNLNAQDTQQTKIVRAFTEELKKALTIQLVLQDETTSTDRALERGATKADKDAWAAALILQDYLEKQL